MASESGATSVPFGEYRSYVKLLAECYLGARYRSRLDASDLAQETLLKAWRDRDQLRGTTEGEISAWLRSILANTLANATRDLQSQKRDIDRERSIDASLEESSLFLRDFLAARGPSPSHYARQEEALDQLAAALDRIPASQREAVLLRHARGLSLAEIARITEKTPGAVAVLVHRGIQRLRELVSERDS